LHPLLRLFFPLLLFSPAMQGREVGRGRGKRRRVRRRTLYDIENKSFRETVYLILPLLCRIGPQPKGEKILSSLLPQKKEEEGNLSRYPSISLKGGKKKGGSVQCHSDDNGPPSWSLPPQPSSLYLPPKEGKRGEERGKSELTERRGRKKRKIPKKWQKEGTIISSTSRSR